MNAELPRGLSAQRSKPATGEPRAPDRILWAKNSSAAEKRNRRVERSQPDNRTIEIVERFLVDDRRNSPASPPVRACS